MRIALAGAGAFGEKHLDGLKLIDGVEITSIISRRLEQAEEVAKKYGAKHFSTELDDALARDDVDAVILCTPTQMHAAQAIACMKAGKHVQVEIPLADSWADAQAVLDTQKETGLTCMVGHTRRFNPSHQYVHNRIVAGEFNIQQMDVQTYFFRRKNMNAKGEPRSWTDHLLWHHAAHTVDLFAYQAGPIVNANARIIPNWALQWTCRYNSRPRAERSAPCHCHSTMTGHWAHSSGTSETPGPISRATTTW
jgi:2-hydroxy-4-carboxymuconate semialdehyde hemiacetal dehydrogenase